MMIYRVRVSSDATAAQALTDYYLGRAQKAPDLAELIRRRQAAIDATFRPTERDRPGIRLPNGDPR